MDQINSIDKSAAYASILKIDNIINNKLDNNIDDLSINEIALLAQVRDIITNYLQKL